MRKLKLKEFLIFSFTHCSVVLLALFSFVTPACPQSKKNIPWPFEDCDRVPFCPTGDLLVELGVAAAM